MPREYVTHAQAAERLGVHVNTIRNWARNGVIKADRYPTGQFRIPASEVERLEREMVPQEEEN